jgi:hypothetical protein
MISISIYLPTLEVLIKRSKYKYEEKSIEKRMSIEKKGMELGTK